MRNKYIFSNLIGVFVFNEHFRPIKSIMFKNNEQYNDRARYEKDFLKKYADLKKPEEKELKRILEFFKKKEYFNEFYTRNLALTRQLIKESVKEDNLIMQSISNIGEIDKVLSMFIKRLREWYELYNPEFSKSVYDNQKFVSMIKKAKKSKDSMGAELPKEDLAPIMKLSDRIIELYKLREEQEEYLSKIMKKYCPNMIAITGITIGAKLLAKAGSLRKLVEFPSSTIQLLGAEEAFFRHLKTHSRSPKYGYLHEHPLIAKNKRELHGKIARALADKIAIAVKVDYFKGKFIGDKLRKGLEEKFGSF